MATESSLPINGELRLIERTWRFQGDTSLNEEVRLEAFREEITLLGEEVIARKQNFTPLTITPAKLPDLAPFIEVPPELQPMLPDQAAVRQHLAALPALVSMVCDAMAQQAKVAQTTTAIEPPLTEESMEPSPDPAS